jgi:hypothetical protein
LWGAKFAYSYLGATSIVRNELLPQAGSITPTGSNVAVPFTGNALVQSFQTNITHQLALIPLIGKSFDSSSWINLAIIVASTASRHNACPTG